MKKVLIDKFRSPRRRNQKERCGTPECNFVVSGNIRDDDDSYNSWRIAPGISGKVGNNSSKCIESYDREELASVERNESSINEKVPNKGSYITKDNNCVANSKNSFAKEYVEPKDKRSDLSAQEISFNTGFNIDLDSWIATEDFDDHVKITKVRGGFIESHDREEPACVGRPERSANQELLNKKGYITKNNSMANNEKSFTNVCDEENKKCQFLPSGDICFIPIEAFNTDPDSWIASEEFDDLVKITKVRGGFTKSRETEGSSVMRCPERPELPNKRSYITKNNSLRNSKKRVANIYDEEKEKFLELSTAKILFNPIEPINADSDSWIASEEFDDIVKITKVRRGSIASQDTEEQNGVGCPERPINQELPNKRSYITKNNSMPNSKRGVANVYDEEWEKFLDFSTVEISLNPIEIFNTDSWIGTEQFDDHVKLTKVRRGFIESQDTEEQDGIGCPERPINQELPNKRSYVTKNNSMPNSKKWIANIYDEEKEKFIDLSTEEISFNRIEAFNTDPDSCIGSEQFDDHVKLTKVRRGFIESRDTREQDGFGYSERSINQELPSKRSYVTKSNSIPNSKKGAANAYDEEKEKFLDLSMEEIPFNPIETCNSDVDLWIGSEHFDHHVKLANVRGGFIDSQDTKEQDGIGCPERPTNQELLDKRSYITKNNSMPNNKKGVANVYDQQKEKFLDLPTEEIPFNPIETFNTDPNSRIGSEQFGDHAKLTKVRRGFIESMDTEEKVCIGCSKRPICQAFRNKRNAKKNKWLYSKKYFASENAARMMNFPDIAVKPVEATSFFFLGIIIIGYILPWLGKIMA